MQGRKEDGKTKKPEEAKKVDPRGCSNGIVTAVDAAAAAAGTGHTLTISDYVARFDEAAKRRLDSMNQKLRDLEMQMEVLEAEMNMAEGSSKWSS